MALMTKATALLIRTLLGLVACAWTMALVNTWLAGLSR
jgi:hypothetical protein